MDVEAVNTTSTSYDRFSGSVLVRRAEALLVSAPALSRFSISSPILRRPFNTWNRGKSWDDQIKPFNFILVATLDPFGLPERATAERFRLIAPYTRNSQDWTRLPWRNMHDPDGPTYRITTDRHEPQGDAVHVKSYGQVLREYRLHPEHKFNGPDGQRCRYMTLGVLQRRPVYLAGPARLIGKEANRLDEVQAGLHAQLADMVNDYSDLSSRVMRTLVLPVLDRYSGRQLAVLVGSDRRTIDRIRHGQEPRCDLRRALLRLAVTHASGELLDDTGSQVVSRSAQDDRAVQVLAAWHFQRSTTRSAGCTIPPLGESTARLRDGTTDTSRLRELSQPTDVGCEADQEVRRWP